MRFFVYYAPPSIYQLLSLFKISFLFTTPVSTLAQRRSCWDAKLFSVNVIFMPVPWKICHSTIVVLLYLLSLIVGGVMVFLAIWMVSLFWSRHRYRQLSALGEKKNMTVCFIVPWSRMKVEQEKNIQHSRFIQKQMERSCILQSAFILWDLFIQGAREEGASSMWRIWHLVWQWAFIVLLADQHWKWSCLAWASTCFWTLGTEYDHQQVRRNALFQPVHGTRNFIFYR